MEGHFLTNDGTRIFYQVVDFTDPWHNAEAVLFVHGLAESTEAWKAWIPYFSRKYRTIRFDMRGFGLSSPMAKDHVWSIEELTADIDQLMSHFGLSKIHLVGWKSGGMIALKFAASYPNKIAKLAVISAPVSLPKETWLPHIEREGILSWLRETMPRRLASLSTEAQEWWIELMSKTPLTTLQGYLRWIPSVNIAQDVRDINCPTLVMTSSDSPLDKIEDTQTWQKTIRNSELCIVPGNCSHLGGAFPDVCAPIVVEFFQRETAQS